MNMDWTEMRRVTCEQCGTEFGCGLSGACWCAAEPAGLPLPQDTASDCLCPACLRALRNARAATDHTG